jgi:hypothetical protein
LALQDVQETLILNGKRCVDFELRDPPDSIYSQPSGSDLDEEKEIAETLH